jgi:serine/threonine protein kinase
MSNQVAVPSLTHFPTVVPVLDSPIYVKCVNQYRRLALVGRGASSKVFAARDLNDGRLYALKQCRLRARSSSAASSLDVEEEIRLLQRIRHPNILSLREVLHVKPSGIVYLVTSLAECGSLESILRCGSLTPEIARYIFRNAAIGLSYLHSLKIVHQDIKPGNILISKSGGVYLTDFGLSHEFDEEATVFGTPLYHAPEVLDLRPGPVGKSAGKADVWSFGVTLYEMLFGKTPFAGRDVYEIIAGIRDTELVAPEGADEDAWELLMGMLAVDPAERFDMEDVVASRYVSEAPQKADLSILAELELEDLGADAPVIVVKATEYRPSEILRCGSRGLLRDEGIQRRCHSFS